MLSKPEQSVPSVTNFLATHRMLVLSLMAVWAAFIAMEVGKGYYFNGSAISLPSYLLYGLYLYLPWIIFSVGTGLLAARSLHQSLFSSRSLLTHLPIAVLCGISHVIVLTSAYWVFWPERVTQVSVQFVLGEQAMKWMHFEVIAYFVLLHVWRRRLLGNEVGQGAALANNEYRNVTSPLALVTDNGVVKLDSEQVDCLLADDNYVIVHADDRQLRVRSTLKEMLKQLHGEHFQQAHRSAVVNMHKVKEIGSQRLVLSSGYRVPVSRRRHRQLLEVFSRL